MAYHLKTRIAIAVSLLIMVFMLLISWIAHAYFEKEFKAKTFQHISDSLDITAATLSNKTHQSLHVLELIAASIPENILENPAEMQLFLDELHSENIIFDNGIGIFTPDGILRAITPRQDDIIGMDFSFRDYIKVTLLNRQAYISAPIKARQKHNHPIIILTEPVLSEGNEVLAILAGSFDLYTSNFLDPLIQNKIGQEGYYMMLDQKETMVVHPVRENILKPASNFFPREQIIQFLLNSKGTIPRVKINGREMIGAFQHVSPLNWTLIALSPLDESYQPISKARTYTALSLTILFLLIILFVRILTNRLTAPLTDLTEKVRLLAKTEDKTIDFTATQYQELGDLSQSIQSLVFQLDLRRKDLKDQLSFLQILIDTIPGPVFYKDASFRYLGCNKAFEECIGISREQLVGKTVYDIAPEELAKIYDKADCELWQQGGERVDETAFRYADGSIHEVIFYKNIFRDAEGNPAGILGTYLDITDRKQWEQALKQSEQRFRLLVENAADAFFLHDSEGVILDVNQQAIESLGYSRNEFLNMRVTDISIDHDQTSIERIQEQLSLGRIVTIEDRHRCKDGSELQVEVRLCSTEQNGGMTIALARDITDRKHAEELLQEALHDAQTAKEQVDNILSSAADGIVVTDRHNRVTHINTIAEEILEVEASVVVGKKFPSIFVNKELREQVKNFLADNDYESHQKDFKVNLSGAESPRVVQARASNLLTSHGEHAGIVTLLHDVTRERELDQIKNEFISTAAHEMRTPMSVIMGYLELLSDEEQFGLFPPEKQLSFLKEAYRKCEALSRIIDDLFDISRIEAGIPLPIEKSDCDVNETLQKVVEHFAKDNKKHSFSCDYATEATALLDRNKLTQVFVNLISNAVKYSPAGGTIKIRTAVEDRMLYVDIIDNGVGMSADQLERIFDKFYRADSSDTAISGLGLGMSIVKTIIEAHHGQISITSTQGVGTHVSLTFPVS